MGENIPGDAVPSGALERVVAKKNGKDPLPHLVELMTEQLAETRLMREELTGLGGQVNGLTCQSPKSGTSFGESTRGFRGWSIT